MVVFKLRRSDGLLPCGCCRGAAEPTPLVWWMGQMESLLYRWRSQRTSIAPLGYNKRKVFFLFLFISNAGISQ